MNLKRTCLLFLPFRFLLFHFSPQTVWEKWGKMTEYTAEASDVGTTPTQPIIFSGWILIRIIYGYASIFWQVDWTALACFSPKIGPKAMENTLCAIIKDHNNPLCWNIIYNYCHKKAKKKQGNMRGIQNQFNNRSMRLFLSYFEPHIQSYHSFIIYSKLNRLHIQYKNTISADQRKLHFIDCKVAPQSLCWNTTLIWGNALGRDAVENELVLESFKPLFKYR